MEIDRSGRSGKFVGRLQIGSLHAGGGREFFQNFRRFVLRAGDLPDALGRAFPGAGKQWLKFQAILSDELAQFPGRTRGMPEAGIEFLAQMNADRSAHGNHDDPDDFGEAGSKANPEFTISSRKMRRGRRGTSS